MSGSALASFPLPMSWLTFSFVSTSLSATWRPAFGVLAPSVVGSYLDGHGLYKSDEHSRARECSSDLYKPCPSRYDPTTLGANTPNAGRQVADKLVETKEKVNQLIGKGKLAKALPLIEQLALAEPDEPSWHFHLAEGAKQMGRSMQAADEYRRAARA